jgi:hypothetical protein
MLCGEASRKAGCRKSARPVCDQDLLNRNVTTSAIGTFPTLRDGCSKSGIRFKADISARDLLPRRLAISEFRPHRKAGQDVRDPRFQSGVRLVGPSSLDAAREFRINLATQTPGEFCPAWRRRTHRLRRLCENRKLGAVPSVTDRDVTFITIAVESEGEAFPRERQQQRIEYAELALSS